MTVRGVGDISGPMQDLLHKDVLLVSGKGGVGKSTVAAALALAAHRRGRRVLVAEVDTNPAMPALLAALGQPAGDEAPGEPCELTPGLACVNMDHDSSVVHYLEEHLPVPRVLKAVVGNPIIGRFLRSAPSVPEMAVLNRIYGLALAMERGQLPYDLLVVDLPALGHAYQVLKAPFILSGMLRVGPAAERSREIRDLLCDVRRTALVLVSLPEDMPVNETVQLGRRIFDDMGLPVQQLVMNQVTSPLLEGLSPEGLGLLPALQGGINGRPGPLADLLAAGLLRDQRAQRSALMLERLRALLPDPHLASLPLVAEAGANLVPVLADHLLAEVSS